MAPTRHSLPLVAAALLCTAGLTVGCRTSVSLEPPQALELQAFEPLPVTLSGSLRGWKERTSSFGQRTAFRFGELLERLFPATDGEAFLSPLGSELRTEWDDAAGEWRARYSLELALQRDGRSHAIHATGAGESRVGPRQADRQALEACVGDAYAQLAALLARLHR